MQFHTAAGTVGAMQGLLPQGVFSAAQWYEFKLFVEHAFSISHDSLHVLVGILLQLVAALLLRRSLASWVPWTVVLVFALANEVLDLEIGRWPNPGMQFGEGVKDIVLTILLPTILLLAIRLRPDLFLTSPRRR